MTKNLFLIAGVATALAGCGQPAPYPVEIYLSEDINYGDVDPNLLVDASEHFARTEGLESEVQRGHFSEDDFSVRMEGKGLKLIALNTVRSDILNISATQQTQSAENVGKAARYLAFIQSVISCSRSGGGSQFCATARDGSVR